MLMSGYLNRDDANAEATWTDAQGRRWLRTGDIGHVDADGNLYLVDRKKDMIISGGQNIYPADIEATLAQHPQVRDVAVIGVASARWGETPLAVVVAAATEASIPRRWSRGPTRASASSSASPGCASSTSCRAIRTARC